MSGWRGVFAGMLALVALEAVVSTTEASGRIGSAIGLVAGGVQRLLSPAVPLVPDRRIASSTSSSSSTTGGNVVPIRAASSITRGGWLSDYQPHKAATPQPVN